jgi:hypothetical protein
LDVQRFEVRPRFELKLTVPADILEAALQDAVEGDPNSWARLPYAEFGIPEDERTTWSPRLAVCVHEPEEGEIDPELRLCCRFQPEPSVWTFYMAVAGALLVGACVAVTWICASFILGTSLVVPSIALIVALVLGAVLFAASQFGQKMAADQMSGLAERLWIALCDANARAEGREPLMVDPG